jgi:hypothetical protein
MTLTTKPVRRETLSLARDRGKVLPLVVELNTTYLKIRFKGRRRAYTVTYDQVLNIGARNAAEAARRAKIEARKAKKVIEKQRRAGHPSRSREALFD